MAAATGMHADGAGSYESWFSGERRAAERMCHTVQATVERLTGLASTHHPSAVEAVDVGADGVCIRSSDALEVGSTIMLELACELPLRVHLGYDLDALVVDGPLHTHLVRVAGTVVRCEQQAHPEHGHLVGIALTDDPSRNDDLSTLYAFLDVLRDETDNA